MSEVKKFPPPNKAAIEQLFKRASHAVGARSPVDMSDPAAVARVLGDVFASMKEEQMRWATELKTAKGWVCDLPTKLGGGAVSWTAVNPTLGRLQVTGNEKWSTDSALEIKEATGDMGELEQLMMRFYQEGALIELPALSPAEADASSAAGAAAAATQGCGKITLMRDTREQMRVFAVKDAPESRKNLSNILALAQRVHVQSKAGADVVANTMMVRA